MTVYQTEQENFWAGQFGSEYIGRNQDKKLLSAKIALFGNILKRGGGIRSCLELGANIGLNLMAIQMLLPESQLSGVEINPGAAKILRQLGGLEVFETSLLDFSLEKQWDMTFTSGVLIHIAPQMLGKAYEALYKHSKRYVLIAEYYNPIPVEISYRGHTEKLFKRDFAGEFMERYSDMQLLEYGFVYHRDPVFPGDDITWFLMEKKK